MRSEPLEQAELERRAAALGALLQAGDVVLLFGPMGAGKTTFTRALATALGLAAPGRVRSPTYTVGVRHSGRLPLMHVDLFRLRDDFGGSAAAAAFESLGLEHEELAAEDQVLVVEWSELWTDPPPDALQVRLRPVEGDPERRMLEAEGTGPRGRALAESWKREVGF